MTRERASRFHDRCWDPQNQIGFVSPCIRTYPENRIQEFHKLLVANELRHGFPDSFLSRTFFQGVSITSRDEWSQSQFR